MSFAETESQVMLADMATRVLAVQNEFEIRRRRLAAAPPDRLALWPSLAEQGILGAAVPESAGGFGGKMLDLAVLMQVIGARLVVEPVLASAVCGRVLLAAGDTEQLSAIIAGERILAFAHTEGFDPFAPLSSTATLTNDGFSLTGAKSTVRHADLAHCYIVSALHNGAPACFLVEAGAAGLSVEPFRLIDASSAAMLNFNATRARYLAGAEALADALLWTQTGLAAEVTGILDALNEITFTYLGTRKQFGVSLAAFQALQHRAADMYAAAEEARALTGRVIRAVDEVSPVRFALASAAKALTDEAGRKIGHEAVQMHGGMGVSDELNVSHYLRRLVAIRAEFGSADLHCTRFAELNEENANAA
jgi:alkylation response protein AidB-like acyl-CoA dehydrogenase